MEFDTFFKREGRAKKLYPVIHVRGEQAEHNVRTAFENGADGVFLINHYISADMLCLIATEVRDSWPNKFIGINFLDRSIGDAWELASSSDRKRSALWGHTLNALWVDDSGIGDRVWGTRLLLHKEMVESSWPGYYFASVAFKHQPDVSDVAMAARNAVPLAHVVVTSGDRTGSPPTVEKIRTMKEAIPDHPLAIASGMTCDNIHLFLPYADIFMVATGISDQDDDLDPRLVERMATIIQNYNKSAGLLA